jgi:high frequency lysogenization protein
MSGLDRFEAQVMALAGLTQGVHLALSVARQGQADPQALAASLASVLHLSADSPEAIYGGLAGVRTGLRLLVDQLRGQQRDADLVRIGATVLSLERRYGRSGDVQARLRGLLQTIADEYGPDRAAEAPAVAALAQAYLATLSTLTPRIRVAGNPLLLKDEANIERIRACLLAALRSAALWHHLGGRGWRLLLQRGRMVETAQRLLGRSLAAVN